MRRGGEGEGADEYRYCQPSRGREYEGELEGATVMLRVGRECVKSSDGESGAVESAKVR